MSIPMSDALQMLFGAGLLSAGVLVHAAADRIRGIKLGRQPRVHTIAAPAAEVAPIPVKRTPIPVVRTAEVIASGTPAKGVSMQASAMAQDVTAALVASGFKKVQAAQAVAACTTEEQASLGSWTRAALRRCAQGSV
jgi:hypothetical protein